MAGRQHFNRRPRQHPREKGVIWWRIWRIRLVAYGARLESVLGNSLGGSNPPSSARVLTIWVQ